MKYLNFVLQEAALSRWPKRRQKTSAVPSLLVKSCSLVKSGNKNK